MKFILKMVMANLLGLVCNHICAQNAGSYASATTLPDHHGNSYVSYNLDKTFLFLNLKKSRSRNTFARHAIANDSLEKPVLLWPGGAPGEQENLGEEKDNTKPGDGKAGGKYVIRLTNITRPSITIYRPQKKNDHHTAVVVCPGGGYSILAMDLEGTEVCEWLNSIGVTAILLKYRVPRRKDLPIYQAPLQDAQRALGLARYNAAKWDINPDHIGIMGFSAGGHLSAALSNNFNKRTYPAVDAADAVSCRPDFAILIYPAYLTDTTDGSKLAPEIAVTDKTPPTFLMQTEDDPVKVENSLYYYLALKKAKVPAEMHLYPTGGHGYGFRDKTGGTSRYPQYIEKWLTDNKF